MRIVSLQRGVDSAVGVVLGDQVVDLRACADVLPIARDIPAGVLAVLEGGDRILDVIRRVEEQVFQAGDAMHEQLRAHGAVISLVDAPLLAPVLDTRLVLACGMNYRSHLHEMAAPVPQRPYAFIKSPQSIIGPGAPIVLPHRHSAMVDWEAEFSAVIGRRCHNVSRSEALDYVAGYTMINDVSARDWVVPFGEHQGMAAVDAWSLNLLGKQFSSFCPMGPVLLTKDELTDPDAFDFTLEVNGEIMQSACTNDLVFSVATLISYYSQFHTFEPGDVITTGSPAGVAFGRKPSAFLKSGDTVTIHAGKIGVLSNPVVASA